jgi:hypothetical protein
MGMSVTSGTTVNVGAAAGPGASAVILGTNSDASRGILTITTGAAPLGAGRLCAIILPQTLIVDRDAYMSTVFNAINGGIFNNADLLVTLYTLIPAGTGIVSALDINNSGIVARIGIASTGPLAPLTTYRFGWRIFT